MQTHSSSCRSTSALSSLRTEAFLILRRLGPTFPTDFSRALVHTYIYAPPAGIPRRILEYEDGGICGRDEGWGFNIVRTFQSVYDCIDSADPGLPPSCRSQQSLYLSTPSRFIKCTFLRCDLFSRQDLTGYYAIPNNGNHLTVDIKIRWSSLRLSGTSLIDRRSRCWPSMTAVGKRIKGISKTLEFRRSEYGNSSGGGGGKGGGGRGEEEEERGKQNR